VWAGPPVVNAGGGPARQPRPAALGGGGRPATL